MNDAALIVATVLVVAVGNPWVVPRLRRWRVDRGRPFADNCEVCGAKPRHVWSLVATFDDDDALGISDGGSFSEATYCRRHRAPEARRRPNRRR